MLVEGVCVVGEAEGEGGAGGEYFARIDKTRLTQEWVSFALCIKLALF